MYEVYVVAISKNMYPSLCLTIDQELSKINPGYISVCERRLIWICIRSSRCIIHRRFLLQSVYSRKNIIISNSLAPSSSRNRCIETNLRAMWYRCMFVSFLFKSSVDFTLIGSFVFRSKSTASIYYRNIKRISALRVYRKPASVEVLQWRCKH